jgi:YD repeat-containing protein
MSQLKTNIRLTICFIFLVFIVQFVAVPFAESVTYTYDDANRLIHEEDGTGTSNEYIYDDDGNLNQKTAGSSGMFFLSVQKSGTGSGTVTSSETPAPYINCGTVCSASYAPASLVRLNASPDGGSLFSGWSGDCSGTANSVDVVMDMTKSCRATFASNTFTVTPSAGLHGTISPSMPQTVNCNSTTSFTLTPDTGYHIASVTGCGGTLSGNTYTTGPITGDCTVTASFAINTYTVTPSAGPNGTISPSTPRTVNYNLTTSFTVTPNTGYSIASVTGCGGTLTGNTYTTGPITSNCTVTASFAINTYSISGRVTAKGNKGLSGVTMTLSGAASATVTTDTSGNYTFTGLANGNYTVTPSKAGYTFTPTNRSVTISGAYVTGQDFTATAIK